MGDCPRWTVRRGLGSGMIVFPWFHGVVIGPGGLPPGDGPVALLQHGDLLSGEDGGDHPVNDVTAGPLDRLDDPGLVQRLYGPRDPARGPRLNAVLRSPVSHHV